MEFDHLDRPGRLGLAASVILIAAICLTPRPSHAQTDDSSAATYDLSAPDGSDWDRVEDTVPDSSGQVLDLPQVVATDDDSAASSGDPNDETPAIASNDDTNDTEDYVNRAAAGSELALAPPPPVIYPPVGGWRYVAIPPTSVIIVQSGGLSPIPRTSPLLTTPRGSGPVYWGWWHRAR